MSSVSRSTAPASGESLRLKELLDHPNWKGEASRIELKQGSYTIMKESGSNFRLIWLDKKGKEVSVPFWIDSSTFQWCFQNGQAHTLKALDETIAHIFKHFKEQDV